MAIDDLKRIALLLADAAEEDDLLLLSKGLNGLNLGFVDKKHFECTACGFRSHASRGKLDPCAWMDMPQSC